MDSSSAKTFRGRLDVPFLHPVGNKAESGGISGAITLGPMVVRPRVISKELEAPLGASGRRDVTTLLLPVLPHRQHNTQLKTRPSLRRGVSLEYNQT